MRYQPEPSEIFPIAFSSSYRFRVVYQTRLLLKGRGIGKDRTLLVVQSRYKCKPINHINTVLCIHQETSPTLGFNIGSAKSPLVTTTDRRYHSCTSPFCGRCMRTTLSQLSKHSGSKALLICVHVSLSRDSVVGCWDFH